MTRAPPRRHSHEAGVLHKARRASGQSGEMSPTAVAGLGERKGSEGKMKSPIQPLRRGDACLMCRAKKLKCSAEKPTCDQCTRRNDRCVYDAVRPASRVEKLERKLAAMEEQERRTAALQRRYSVETMSQYQIQAPPTPIFGIDDGQPILGPLDYSNIGLAPSTVGPIFSGAPPNTHPSTSHFDQPQPYAWPTCGPGPFTPASLSGHAMICQPLPTEAVVQVDGLPWPLLGATTELSTYWTEASKCGTPQQPSTSASPQVQGLEALNAMFPLTTTVPSQPMPPPVLVNTAPCVPDIVSQTVEEVISQAASLEANRMGECEVSQSARKYLLDLFFCPSPPRPNFGSEVFTEAQFRARLLLHPEEQPHDCLLFAMYTSAASHSYIPAVRSLESALYAIASHKLDEAIAHQDRMLDAINASKSLSKWLFSKSRPLEAYQYSFKAVSLCMSCGLHRISSSVFVPVSDTRISKADDKWPILGPPKDSWDLCQRIHAFWSTWGNDRGMMMALPWPSAMRDELITTPLPHPPEEFLENSVKLERDLNLRSLYALRPVDTACDYFFTWYLTAVHLLTRARELTDGPPENRPSYRQIAFESPDTVRTPRKDYPLAYREMMELCQYIEGNLPAKYAIRTQKAPAWVNPDVPVLHMCLITTRMFLHPMEGDDHDKWTGTRAALEAASLIELWLQHFELTEGKSTSYTYGVPIPPEKKATNTQASSSSRLKNGISGPYCLTAWFWVANRLVKGAMCHRQRGRMEEAELCTREAQKIVEGLKSIGLWSRIASHSAQEAECLERATRPGSEIGVLASDGDVEM